MEHRLVVLYIDNEAARFGLIKGLSPTRNCAWILDEIWKADAALEAVTWIERVPSASNCADHPSRGKFEILEELEVETKRVPVPQRFEKSLVEQWWLTTGRVGPRPM